MSALSTSSNLIRITEREAIAGASPRALSLPGMVEAGLVLESQACGGWCVSWPGGRLSAFPGREGLECWWEWQRELFLERRPGFASIVGAAATASEEAHGRLLHRVRLIRARAPYQWRDHFPDVPNVNPEPSEHCRVAMSRRWLESSSFWADVEDAVLAVGIQRERAELDTALHKSPVRAILPQWL